MKYEIKKLKATLKFLVENRKVAQHNLLANVTGQNRESLMFAIERLDYAAEGVRRLLKDAQSAKQYGDEETMSEGQAESLEALYEGSKTDAERKYLVKQAAEQMRAMAHKAWMWNRERRSLQKRIGEQRRQLDDLLKKNKALQAACENMMADRKRLLEDSKRLLEDIVQLRHQGEEPVCEGCPMSEYCSEYKVAQ